MKLERISENKIRCTLNKADLADKHLLLNELAYGTDKAKELFSEMMQKASAELGFEADNIPLMVEAIPVSADCLILNITKVEDPEEFDARFSSFTHEIETDEDDDTEYLSDIEEYIDGTSAILDNLREILHEETLDTDETDASGTPAHKSKRNAIAGQTFKQQDTASGTLPADTCRIYRFHDLTEVSMVAELLETLYNDTNSLYKNPHDNLYYLIVMNTTQSTVFNRVCNILGEYGTIVKSSYAAPSYIQEHYRLLLGHNALQSLSKL